MILVTGGTGFLGAHLLVHLAQKNEPVRAIYRTQKRIEKARTIFSYYQHLPTTLFSKIEWVQADITDLPSMIFAFTGVDKVFHCAALVSFDSKDYRAMRRVNIQGTATVVNLAIEAKVKKLCHVSSIAAIGDDALGGILTEKNEWVGSKKDSGYAITKYGAEMEVWRAAQEGVKVVIVNPGIILGSGFWNTGSGTIFSKMHAGFPFYSEGITGFVGVRDVVKCMTDLMESRHEDQRFILVSENKSFKEVLYFIADAFGIKKPARPVKPWQTAFLWRLEWLVSKITPRKIKLGKHAAKALHSKAFYSSKKIRQTLRIQFESVPEVIKQVSNDFLL